VVKPTEQEKGFLAVDKQGQVMGYGFLRYFPEKKEKRYTTSLGIVVSDKFQGQGVGKALMDYMIGEAKKQNMKKIWLGVYSDNEKAIEFYKKFGFEIEGVFMYDEYFDNHPRHVVSMALFLDENIKDTKELRKQFM
jgi:ribosomal protein S18 acetylase RimI-like enzyme